MSGEMSPTSKRRHIVISGGSHERTQKLFRPSKNTFRGSLSAAEVEPRKHARWGEGHINVLVSCLAKGSLLWGVVLDRPGSQCMLPLHAFGLEKTWEELSSGGGGGNASHLVHFRQDVDGLWGEIEQQLVPRVDEQVGAQLRVFLLHDWLINLILAWFI